MAFNLTNSNITAIAYKRLSGKAMTSGRRALPQEPIGSFVQTTNTTLFADAFPTEPTSQSADLHKIQSASEGAAGSVMYVEFELEVLPGTSYSNDVGTDTNTNLAEQSVYDSDLGDQTSAGDTDTFHGYQLKLKTDFETSVGNVQDFDTHASTTTALGTAPFANSFAATGSTQFQIVPEYITTVNVNNPYKPVVIDKTGAALSATDGIDYYLDTAAGILFVQDPVAAFDANSAQVPNVLRAFLYVGKYQNEISTDLTPLEASASLGIHFSSSGDPSATNNPFSVALTETASFIGGDGIQVDVDSNTITISSDYGELDSALFIGTSSADGLSVSGSSLTFGATASFSASGPGLSVDYNDAGRITYTIDPDSVLGGVTETTTFNFTASHAASASGIFVANNENTDSDRAIIFAADVANNDRYTTLESDESIFRFNPGSNGGTITFNATNAVTMDGSQFTPTATTFNFATHANTDTLNIGNDDGGQTVVIKGSASIAGDLTVLGTTTTLQTENLLVEDKFILLNSGAAVSEFNEGGLIVQTQTNDAGGKGTAFYYDANADRWILTSGSLVAQNVTSVTADITKGTNTMAALVTVQVDDNDPDHTPFFNTTNFNQGQMYVDKSQTGLCDDNIWIYS